MALLDRIANCDSIEEMDQAREDRYWDGIACGIEDRHFGACYLWGYVVEMSLKVAYFRASGVVGTTEDLAPQLRAAQDMARVYGAQNLHDLDFWAQSLIALRQRTGRPLSPSLAVSLTAHVDRVAQNWSEVMRYRRSIPAVEEVSEVLNAVDWILSVYPQLGS